MRHLRDIALWALISSLAAFVGFVAAPYLARAEDWQDRLHWADKALSVPPGQHVRPFRPERHAPRVRSYVKREPAISREQAERLRQHQHDTACRPLVRVVGDQRPTEEGAKEQADKAWMQEARFRYGERFMDIAKHAKDIRYACSRSSVGELAGVTQHRCEVIAVPCPAPILWGQK